MGPADILHSIVTGPPWRRTVLTPIGLVVFVSLTVGVIVVSPALDAALGLPALLSGPSGVIAGLPLVAAGAVLVAWCIACFLKARGTPVPTNPPRELIVRGPYSRVRNPMLTGFFACLFGAGIALHSLSLAAIVTPALVAGAVLLLKLVEEPELELRFGAPYEAYRKRVPMFFPVPRRARP